MKKSYLHNTKKKNKTFFVAGGIFAAIFLIIFLSYFFSSSVLFLTKPIYKIRNSVSEKIVGFSSLFKEKSQLLEENRELRRLLQEKYILEQEIAVLRLQNEEFKGVLSRKEKNQYILSSIIKLNSFGNLNTLILDAGTKHGVKNEMPVTAFGNVLLGQVEEVSLNSSKIKLISFPGVSTDIFIGGHVSAVATGRGGENLEIVLPADIDIRPGEPVSTLDTVPLIVGATEKIIKNPADPFQKILFRLPININELRHVYIIKN